MLLFTASVLQLGEVMHPDLLAHVIRPQEPQPDLLGNLLHETAGTHAKQMLLSLVIYSFLLFLQVHFPLNFLLSTGLGDMLSFFKLKFCYILMLQLQVPLELLVFLGKNIGQNIAGCTLMWLMPLISLSNCDYELKNLPRLILGPIHSNQVMGTDPVGSHRGTWNSRSNSINPTCPYQSHD